MTVERRGILPTQSKKNLLHHIACPLGITRNAGRETDERPLMPFH